MKNPFDKIEFSPTSKTEPVNNQVQEPVNITGLPTHKSNCLYLAYRLDSLERKLDEAIASNNKNKQMLILKDIFFYEDELIKEKAKYPEVYG